MPTQEANHTTAANAEKAASTTEITTIRGTFVDPLTTVQDVEEEKNARRQAVAAIAQYVGQSDPTANDGSPAYSVDISDGQNLPIADGDSLRLAISKMIVGLIPTGSLIDFAGASAPTGYLLCNGAAVSRTTYARLFAAIGTTWGAGDGTTTFNVPDLRGRAAIGAGTGASLTVRTLGDTGGEETHQLTVTEMPSHVHGITAQYGASNAIGAAQQTVGLLSGGYQNSQPAGGDGAHNNMQPYGVVTKCIKWL